MPSFTQYEVPLAKAVASAVAADVIAAPSIMSAVRDGSLTRRSLNNIVLRDMHNEVERPGVKPLFPRLRSVLRTQMNIEEGKLKGGMDQFAELASAIAGAVGGVFGAKYTSEANKDIAKIQANTQLQIANLQANADKLALAQAQGFPKSTATVAAQGSVASIQGSLPSWAIPAAGGGALLLGAAVYFMTRKKGR